MLDPQKPVTLTLWHVFGAQTDGPMNGLVARFNRTVGREKGIVVNVTAVSNSTDIHFALVAAAKKYPGAGSLPDMFITYPKTVFAIGPERLMNWKDWLPEEKRLEFISSFVEEGTVDGRLVLLPVAKSLNVLFINATIFDQFAMESGVSYDDLATWEGMFAAATRYYKWSGGKAFFKYDDWLHYSMLNTVSLGGNFFQGEKINFRDERFRKVWHRLAESALSGGVCLLGGYSTTAMMTGETLCGVGSTASVLYFKDTVTYPDNTTIPLRLKILPVPTFQEGRLLAVQRGGGLGVIKSTPQKEYAASIFGRWLTDTENNVPFVTATGYSPVKEDAHMALVKEDWPSFTSDSYKDLYKTISNMHMQHSFYVPPLFEGYGEMERDFSELQREIFSKYRKSLRNDAQISPELLHSIFQEFEQSLD